MTLRKSLLAAAAIACGAVAAAQTDAATITRTYEFTAGDFITGSLTTATGSFTVTFDPAVQVLGETAGLTLNDLDLTVSDIAFDYLTFTDQLRIYGTTGGSGTGFFVPAGPNDFYLLIDAPASAAPSLNFFEYILTGDQTPHSSRSGSLALDDGSTIPEPATLAIVGLGLAGLTLARRRRARL